MYHDSFRFYPSWLKNCPDHIYQGVYDPIKLGLDDVQLMINGRRYAYLYQERDSAAPDDWEARIGNLVLKVDEQLVLGFDIWKTLPAEPYDETTYRIGTVVNAFVEGPWVMELQVVLTNIKAHEKASAEIWKKRKGKIRRNSKI